MRNVNFALRAGIFVPRRVNVVSVSTFPVLVDVFPEFRDDLFFVAEDEIVFLSPDRRIVDIVPIGTGPIVAESSSDVLLSTAEIRDVQEVLIDEGFDVEVNGVFDTRTREALIRFQRKRGLRANGIVNTRTVAALGLSNRISQSHVRNANRSSTRTTGRAEIRRPSAGSNMAVRRNQQNAEGPRSRSTVGQGGAERQPNMQRPSTRSTTGQGHREGPPTSGAGRMQRSAPRQTAPNR